MSGGDILRALARLSLIAAGISLGAPSQADPPLIPLTARFTKDAAIDDHRQSGSVDGIAFEFFHGDGSGTFASLRERSLDIPAPYGAPASWRVGCQRNRMTDVVHCFVSRGDVSVVVARDGTHRVILGDEHFPGRPIAFRVGRNPAVVATGLHHHGAFSIEASRSITQQLSRSGESAYLTRYVRWPRDEWVEEENEHAIGFRQALAYATWAARTSRK